MLYEVITPESFSEAGMAQRAMESAGLVPEEVLLAPFPDVLVFRFTRGKLRAFSVILFTRIELRIASDLLVIFFDSSDRVLYYGFV